MTSPSIMVDNEFNDQHVDNTGTMPSSPPPPPPNGGLTAWMQVAGGFMIFFNTWGMISAFSVFQTYYESGSLFHASASSISWIGAVQAFLVQLFGLVAGPLYDRGYLRSLLLLGASMVVIGLMMLSLSTEYWQAILSQAICIGIGGGLLFVPTVSLLPTWFTTRLGLAVGIASSGSAVGGVVYPVVLYRLISQIGFPWAVRCVGFIALATFLVPLTTMKMRAPIAKPRAVVDWSAFRDFPFILLTLAVLLVFVANSVLLFYISFYPLNRKLTNESMAFYMAAILNAASVAGRILPNALSDHIGVFNTLAPLTLLLGVALICLVSVQSQAGIIIEAVVTGFLCGVVVALPPVCFGVLTDNKSMIGTRIGQGFATAGIGLLIGGPVAGAILGSQDHLNWTSLWTFSGAMACIASVLIGMLRILKAGSSVLIKA